MSRHNTDERLLDSLKAKQYHALKNKLFFVHLLINVAVLWLLLKSGLSLQAREAASGLSPNVWVADGVYLLGLFSLLYFVGLPLNLFEGFWWEHRFHLSHQTFSSWLWDDIKKAFLSVAVSLIAVEAVYYFLRHFSQTWWVAASFFWLFLSLGLARLMPSVIIPMFYRYVPIDNEELRGRILALFRKAGLKITDAYAIDFSAKTKKANAMICGLGNNRRVVLTDNLIKDFTGDEIETVLAHEIAHYKNHDIVKLTLVNSLATFFSFWVMDRYLEGALSRYGFTRLSDVAFFPMMAMAFMVLGLFLMPFLNAFSRILETAADAQSVKLTRKPEALISAFMRLGDTNLAEFEPGLVTEILFYDHPPLAKRIGMLRRLMSQTTSAGDGSV